MVFAMAKTQRYVTHTANAIHVQAIKGYFIQAVLQSADATRQGL